MSALQLWMKRQGVYEKELHDLLREYGVRPDFRGVDEAQWDRIHRRAECMRESKATKDGLRFSRKFLKLENMYTTFGDEGHREWHKNTKTKKKKKSHGIRHKKAKHSHHNTKKKKVGSPPDPHKKKKGKALKLWLRRNHCYLDALYRELIKKGADSPNLIIRTLSKQQLDGIVRRVRIERFGQFQDQTACSRFVAWYDQLLVANGECE